MDFKIGDYVKLKDVNVYGQIDGFAVVRGNFCVIVFLGYTADELHSGGYKVGWHGTDYDIFISTIPVVPDNLELL